MTRPLFMDRFRAIAAERPDAVAVESRPTRLTYRELATRAAQLGERLQRQGAGPERVIGLALEKSPEYLVAMLGVWCAGAAFVPLDPTWPQERRDFLLQDSGAALVVTLGDFGFSIFDFGLPAASPQRRGGPPSAAEGSAFRNRSSLGVDFLGSPLRLCGQAADGPIQNQKSKSQNGKAVREGDLAYIIYTSGSTGAPKGVMVPHRGIVNVLEAQIPVFRLGPRSRALLYLSTSFDASISDIGATLLAGATLCIEPASPLETAAGLMEILRARRITHLDLPPALLRILDPAAAPACLETIIIGGEPSPPAVVRRWAERCRVVNVYGPTEATICCSLCVCSAASWDRPLLGHPIPHTSLHLLDADWNAVPAGTPAELYIGGIGLARGYRNRADLDAAKFIHHNGERLYRTGDQVVEHADGEIEFLGRIDRQVKRHGLLIAPEEIEAQLLRHPQVARAAVVARGGGAGRELLVAYLVPQAGARLSTLAIRRHLAAALPPWMLPQRFEYLESMPVTPAGKIDLAALARWPLSAPAPIRARAAPRTDDEKALVEIWQRVLGVDSVGIMDDFFALGGDSLGVLEVVAAAEARGLRLSPALMMAHPTIAGVLSSLHGAAGRRGDAMSCQALRQDAGLGAEWQQRLSAARARPHPVPRAAAPELIFLTGATGFLGSRLLGELLCRTRAPVVCLARAASPAAARQRCLEALARHGRTLPPAEAARVRAVCGDLAQPRLGLEDREWSLLAAEVDTVYHCAAQVNMLLPYAALRPSNVGGTAEVLRLLSEGRTKRLHHASTLSVFVASDRNTGRMAEEDTLERMEWVYGGYAQSKWAAEHQLRASRGDAGPIAFYRFGLVTGDTVTGDAAAADFLSLFFRGTASLGCVPAHAGSELRIDVTPVDFAAAATAHLSLHAAAEEGLSTFHLASPRGATVAELVDALRAVGVTVETVDEGEWQRRLQSRLDEGSGAPVSAAYLALCRCLSTRDAFERHRTMDLFQATGAEFGMERTLTGLRGSGLACPPAGPELLRIYARHALGLAAGANRG